MRPSRLPPQGLVLAVLGPDGVGKTAIIEAIEPIVSAGAGRSFFYWHLRPRLLPPLSRLRGRVEQTNIIPHGAKASRQLLSVARLVYLLADYILGYWFLVRTKISRQGSIAIFDRYAYDIVMDPKRYRINLPKQLIKVFIRAVPKPHIILCLHARPSLIASRKPELSVEEIDRQIFYLKEFAANEPRAVLLSTEGSLEKVAARAGEIVHQALMQRARDCRRS